MERSRSINMDKISPILRPFHLIFCSKQAQRNFWNKVDKNGDCWNWKAYKHTQGYGLLGLAGKVVKAHRISYFLANNYIDASLKVLHKCDNPSCVNPDHLFQGTQNDNVQDMIKKRRARHSSLGGELNGMSKANWEIVKNIRNDGNLKMKQKDISKKHNLSPMTISRIIRRLSWKNPPQFQN